ncbi:MAG: cation:proton antiporter [Candidatus Woesearchaeota archaeon]
MAAELFTELSLIILIALLGAGFMRLFKQPVLIGYILAGIVVSVFGLLRSHEAITGFADIGLALLLFMVGIGLNPKIVRTVGKVSLLAGVGQVFFTSIVGFGISIALGFSLVASAYIAVALTFSSTIIIMKILSDSGELETLPGRIAVGILIVQDIIAVLILMIISALGGAASSGTEMALLVLKGIGFLIVLGVVSKLVLPWLTTRIARNQELLLLFSLSWCLSIAGLFSVLGFGLEIGALAAGIAFSVSPYRHEISSRLRPIRDFFIAIFFIVLGAQLSFGSISGSIIPLIVFSVFVLIGNPFIVLFIMGRLGYTKRTGFLVGLTVAQVSEFSIVLIALGIKAGHLSAEIQNMFTIVALITIAGSTYFMRYDNQLYKIFSSLLGFFERKGKKVDEHTYSHETAYDVILFGHNRIGYDLLETFKRIKSKFLVVDYNPETIVRLAKEGFDCKYGDASDIELLNELQLHKTKMVVSTIPDMDTNLLLLNQIKEASPKCIVIMVSHQVSDAMQLYDTGATYVILPHFLGGTHTSAMIEDYGLDAEKFLKNKIAHIEHLKTRRQLGHEHPGHERG